MKKSHQATQRRSAFPPAASLPASALAQGHSVTRETPLRFRTFGLSADEASKGYIRRHLGFKLGKFALDIEALDVHVKHESGPKGEPTVVCTITVRMRQAGTVVVEKDAGGLLPAFDRAAEVVERTVRRTLQRQRVVFRSGGQPPEP
jgi:ribosome-associated translation inhibitor RaiA